MWIGVVDRLRNQAVHNRTIFFFEHLKKHPFYFAFSIPARLLFLHLDYNIELWKNINWSEFEELVILTIGILNNEAYSVAIKDEIESRLSRDVSMGALHTALKKAGG